MIITTFIISLAELLYCWCVGKKSASKWEVLQFDEESVRRIQRVVRRLVPTPQYLPSEMSELLNI